MEYADDVIQEANEYPTLGAEYFDAREKAREVLSGWNEKHSEEISNGIVKPLVEEISSKANDMLIEYLLMDAEYNLHDYMRRMVEKSVFALIGGHKWANVKYITPESLDGEKVRETLAKLYADEIKNMRIDQLEKELAETKQRLEYSR